MTIGRICQREVDLADLDETAQAAGQRMAARNVGSLVVVDLDRRPLGILTDRDLALQVVGRGHDPREVRVGAIMSSNPVTVTEGTPIEGVLSLMRQEVVRRVLVVDDDGRLVGLASVDDVLALFAEEFATLGGLVAKTSPQRVADV